MQTFCFPFLAILWQVLTRRDQLKLKEKKAQEKKSKEELKAKKEADKAALKAAKQAEKEAKKAAKEAEKEAKKAEKKGGRAKKAAVPTEDAVATDKTQDENGDNVVAPPEPKKASRKRQVAAVEPSESKPAVEPKPKRAAKAKAKVKAQAKPKANAKKETKENENQDIEEMVTPKKRLFQEEGAEASDDRIDPKTGKVAKLSEIFDDDIPKRAAKAARAKSQEETGASAPAAKAKAKAGKGKRKTPELSPFAKKENKRRKKAELETKQESPVEDLNVQGIMLQHIKHCRDLTVTGLKEYLYSKVTKKYNKSYLNAYIPKQACGVKAKLEDWKVPSEIFYFGRCGTAPDFNAACVIAYVSASLMVPWLHFFW